MLNKRDLFWAIILMMLFFLVCGTFVYLQAHSWIIRFEMDNNTLEAVKSINWSALPK